MALTPNYSWPTPDNTDLVKDGAEAIRDLGNAIDNTVNSLPSGGLVHIETQTFSAVSSFSLDDVFSATYENYRVNINLTSGSSITMRLRTSGTDDSSASYAYVIAGASWNNTLFSTGASGQTSMAVFTVATVNSFNMDFIRPFLATPTNILGLYARYSDTGIWNGQFRDTTSFDGFSLLGSNLTGVVRVYGYQN